MKRCTKCHRSLPEQRFNRNKNARDGLNYWCKDCQRVANQQYWQAKTHQYTVEQLLSYGPEIRLEALRDHSQTAIRFDDLEKETGISRTTLNDWTLEPWRFCDRPEFDADLMDLAIRRVLERRLGE